MCVLNSHPSGDPIQHRRFLGLWYYHTRPISFRSLLYVERHLLGGKLRDKRDEDPEYEARLRHRLGLLQDRLKAGKIVFAPGLKVVDSLSAIRTDKDGKIDLNTVDSAVRALALGAEAIHERE